MVKIKGLLNLNYRKILPILMALAPLVLSGQSVIAQSLSQGDLNSIYDNTVWYQPSGNGCTANVDVSLSGNGQIQQAFNFFVSKGLSAEQAAGIVGNFKWESGVDPTKENGGTDSNTPGDTWGIAQWTQSSGRLGNLEKYAQQNNLNIDDLATQLAFAWYELSQGTETNVLGYLKQVSGFGIQAVDSASNIVFNNYEGAGDATGPKRAQLSEEVYQQYGGSTGTTISTPIDSTGCASVGPGQDTQYINGFTVYNQYDPSWANDPYGSTTIAVAGCGPSAMAMIITALTGQQVTPDVAARYADSQNLYVDGEGSSWSISPVLAQHWNLHATLIGADTAKITAALQSGALVIAAGEGPSPFTSEGHFLVIRSVTADGMWQVGDSGNSSTSSKDWSPQQLTASMNGGSVYAISK
ncbi:MAG TPA: phage tail tip lysozyme [Candidatus Saccharimonadales bacterium]|nr:phage tail tip lysozyme [Candidatus Saccharimonadales bacterium]